MANKQASDTFDDSAKMVAATPASLVPTETVELDTPIQRGGKTITHIDIRKPLAGALRGVSLVDVMQMDMVSLGKVLPRITEPALSEAEIRNMDPADVVQLGAALSDFLTAKKFKASEQQ